VAVIRLANFGGVAPRYARSLLRGNMASEAENVRLWHGALAPFRMPLPVHTAPDVCVRTMHRFGCRWLTWDDPCVDVAEWLPTCERVYVTGVADYPLVAEQAEAGTELVWQRVGLPVPERPSAMALDASKPIQTTSSRIYVITYVNSFGEEGAPSLTSDPLLDMHEGAVARVTIPAPPTDWDIAAVRLYRVAEGFVDGTQAAAPTSSSYLFVAELPPVAQTFDDAMASDALAEANVSLTYTPPPGGLHCITQLPDGVLAGAVGRQVWFSEPYQPQAWPVDYLLALDDTVCALVWSNGALYALTDGHPYAIAEECVDGKCCRQAFRFPVSAPIESPKSAVAAPDGAVYATPSGLMQLSGRRMALITGPWYAKDDWQALLPHTMIGAIVDGQYIAATCAAAFLFDIHDGIVDDGIEHNELMPLTLTTNALHTTRDGKLYLAFGNVVHEWDAAAEFLPYRWRSKQVDAAGQANFAAARVALDGYPWPSTAPAGMRFQWITDGRVALDRCVKHSAAFRLPSSSRNVEFSVEVSGAQAVREIAIATGVRELSHAVA
jgi:hypothetical protein